MPDGDTQSAQQSSGEPAKPKPAKPTKPQVTQAEPTKAPARCPDTGLELDQFGLPFNGVFRAARLAALGIEDPALNPTTDTEIVHD